MSSPRLLYSPCSAGLSTVWPLAGRAHPRLGAVAPAPSRKPTGLRGARIGLSDLTSEPTPASGKAPTSGRYRGWVRTCAIEGGMLRSTGSFSNTGSTIDCGPYGAP